MHNWILSKTKMYSSHQLNTRTLQRARASQIKPQTSKGQHGFIRLTLALAVAGVLVWSGLMVGGLGKANADASVPEIRSALAGYCLDDYRSNLKPGSIVDAWSCNGTPAQQFSFTAGRIELDAKYCLGQKSTKVELDPCAKSNSQLWSIDATGFSNDSNSQCLSLSAPRVGAPLKTASCQKLSSLSESWTQGEWPGAPLSEQSAQVCDQTKLGERVACNADNEWLAWETEPALHQVLLNDYTDGNVGEEWCADFVSFVYAQSGAPFSGGERDGWDEYNANNIVYQGFTYHDASSGYLPHPGDVAFFNYSGGHVEIVSIGGKHPTFIYGDSGTIDPLTGNGNMAQSQITSDGSAGQLEYYLSPDTGV